MERANDIGSAFLKAQFGADLLTPKPRHWTTTENSERRWRMFMALVENHMIRNTELIGLGTELLTQDMQEFVCHRTIIIRVHDDFRDPHVMIFLETVNHWKVAFSMTTKHRFEKTTQGYWRRETAKNHSTVPFRGNFLDAIDIPAEWVVHQLRVMQLIFIKDPNYVLGSFAMMLQNAVTQLTKVIGVSREEEPWISMARQVNQAVTFSVSLDPGSIKVLDHYGLNEENRHATVLPMQDPSNERNYDFPDEDIFPDHANEDLSDDS